MNIIKRSMLVETLHMVMGIIEYLGAAAVMVQVAFSEGCCAKAEGRLVLAVALIIGGTLSMHLAEHQRQREFRASDVSQESDV